MIEFANDGGPLLVAPRSPAAVWEGSELPSAGRVVTAATRTAGGAATDYDRACDVEAGAALLNAGAGWVVVLNSEVAGAAWLPLAEEPASAAIIAVSGGLDESLPEIYELLASGEWTPLSDGVPIDSGGVFLMHAAGKPGSEDELAFNDPAPYGYATIGQAIVYPFPAGCYRVEMLEHVRRRTEMQPGALAVLIRLTRVGQFGASA